MVTITVELSEKANKIIEYYCVANKKKKTEAINELIEQLESAVLEEVENDLDGE